MGRKHCLRSQWGLKAIASLVDLCGPGGTIVLVGVPVHENSLDIAGAVTKEIEIRTVFRYANVLDRALNLIALGKVDLKPLISETFALEDSITAFERAAKGLQNDVKLQIELS
ncbi:hypothetical protein [Sinorhizobium medicae]|uniref:hypothetical protein n=1 Tax=Sinorhizobium medicae TaxID=110321 RepID=UPI0004861700|nr:hypothetical protein [Sinorhizobium medicae]